MFSYLHARSGGLDVFEDNGNGLGQRPIVLKGRSVADHVVQPFSTSQFVVILFTYMNTVFIF